MDLYWWQSVWDKLLIAKCRLQNNTLKKTQFQLIQLNNKKNKQPNRKTGRRPK